MELSQDIRNLLYKKHQGEVNAIKSHNIEKMFGVSGLQVRQAVNFLRCDSIPIGSGTTGYYFITSPEEKEKTLSHLRGRIIGISKSITGLKQASV